MGLIDTYKPMEEELNKAKVLLTGAAGFIGSNILDHLVTLQNFHIVVLEKLDDVQKLISLAPYREIQIENSDTFNIEDWDFEFVIHQGAISATTETDATALWKQNIEFTIRLAKYCSYRKIPLIYASSASVYGLAGDRQSKNSDLLKPLNGYGASKLITDNYLETQLPGLKFFGLRYFNVYGPGELNKGDMMSPVTKFFLQAKNTGTVQVFKEENIKPEFHFARDFIFVGDICRLIQHLLATGNQRQSCLIDVGTGTATSFQKVADLVCEYFNGRVEKQQIDMPASINNHYQKFTRAELSGLEFVGYREPMTSIRQGVNQTLSWLDSVT